MLKLLIKNYISLATILLFLVPSVSYALVFKANQLVPDASFGVIYATTTNPNAFLSATSSPTLGYVTATSTTATSTFSGGVNVTGQCLAVNGICLNAASEVTGSGGAGLLTSWLTSSSVTATSAPTAAYYVATSTTKASIFPYASTTAISSSGGAWFATGGGKVSVGTTTPDDLFTITGSSAYTDDTSSNGGLLINDSTTPKEKLFFGVDRNVGANGSGFIQSYRSGTAYTNLLLNALGGSVGVGSSTPTATLTVVGAVDTTNGTLKLGSSNNDTAQLNFSTQPTPASASARGWAIRSNGTAYGDLGFFRSNSSTGAPTVEMLTLSTTNNSLHVNQAQSFIDTGYAFGFCGDNCFTTYISSPDGSALSFRAGAASNVIYAKSQSVGIGTTTPRTFTGTSIDAYGALVSGLGDIRLARDLTDSSARRNWGFQTETNVVGDFGIAESTTNIGAPATARLSILSGGKIGINKTSPTSLLHLKALDGTNLGLIVLEGSAASAGNYWDWATDGGTDPSLYFQHNGVTKFLFLPSGELDLTTNTTASEVLSLKTTNSWAATLTQTDGSIFTINNGGVDMLSVTALSKVGIGTTTPVSQFSNTSVSFTSASGSGGTGTDLNWYGNAQGYVARFGNQSTATNSDGVLFKIAATDAASYILSAESGGTQKFEVSGNGNVGVGTSTPWRVFSTSGTVAMANLTTASGVISGGSYLCEDANSQVVSDTSTCLVSSRRFKNTIEPLSGAASLAEVLKLKPVSFVYNMTGNPVFDARGPQVGFIAEDVAAVEPRLVEMDKNGAPFAVKYEQMTSLIVKAFQAFEAEVTSLLWNHENRLQKLEAENASLKARLDKLEKK